MSLLQTLTGPAVREPITITARQLEEERTASQQQCCALYRGRTLLALCQRGEGHEGPHRGERVQWTIAPRQAPVPKLTRPQRAMLLTAEERADGLTIRGYGEHRVATSLEALGFLRVARTQHALTRVDATPKGRRAACRVRAAATVKAST